MQGFWERLHQALYATLRVKAGRDPHPKAAITDSQGLIIRVLVRPDGVSDCEGVMLLLALLHGRFPRLQHIWADGGYTGKVGERTHQATLGCTLEIVKHWWTGLRLVWVAPGQEPPTIPHGFHVLPRRWVVERTFAWLLAYLRPSKGYEEPPETSEALIDIAMSHLMVKRLPDSILFREPLISSNLQRFSLVCMAPITGTAPVA